MYNHSASIYHLNNKNFKKYELENDEYISDKDEKVLYEEKIGNVFDDIADLEQQHKEYVNAEKQYRDEFKRFWPVRKIMFNPTKRLQHCHEINI